MKNEHSLVPKINSGLMIPWFVGHWAGGAEGDHRGSEDQERGSPGCHTRSFKRPREHERSDDRGFAFFFPYSSFASFDVGCSRLADLRIQRQNSCESISSLNSLTSMSSMGSMKDQDAKKKKKKSWVMTQHVITTLRDGFVVMIGRL